MEQSAIKLVLSPSPGDPDLILPSNAATEYLLGWPGYRTQWGKTGLDLIDSQCELAHMLGLSTRWLLSGKFRTRNPFFLFLMVMLGLVGITPLLFVGASGVLSGDWSGVPMVGFYGFHVAFGIAILINVGLSIFTPNDESIIGGSYEELEVVQGGSREQLEAALLLVALIAALVFARTTTIMALPDGCVVQLNFRILGFIALFGRLAEIGKLKLPRQVLDAG